MWGVEDHQGGSIEKGKDRGFIGTKTVCGEVETEVLEEEREGVFVVEHDEGRGWRGKESRAESLQRVGVYGGI